MNSLEMAIVRYLTENDAADVGDLSAMVKVTNTRGEIQAILDSLEGRGYVARLDHDKYTMTR